MKSIVKIANLPTPLDYCSNISKIYGYNIYIKRDDLTGLCAGGNKVRIMDIVINKYLKSNIDTFLASADKRSNKLREIASLAAKFNIECHFLLYDNYSKYDIKLGNEFLLNMFGVKTTLIDKNISRKNEIKELINIKNDLKKKGKRPVILHKDRMYGIYATIAYYEAAKEILLQSNKNNINFQYIIVPVGAGMTISGLILGLSHFESNTTIIGVCTSKKSKYIYNDILKFIFKAKNYLKINNNFDHNNFIFIDDFVLDIYGSINNIIVNSIRIFALNEGIFLDPIYNAKCFSALTSINKYVNIQKNDNILFLNTGGFTELFTHHNILSQNNV